MHGSYYIYRIGIKSLYNMKSDLGTYEIKVGASAADIRLNGFVALDGEHRAKPLREYYFSEVTVK